MEMFGREIRLHLLGDNQAAIALAKNGGTWRSRHYVVKAAALREAHRQQRLDISFVSTTEQVADMFTKLLGTMLSRRMRFLAGMGTGETRPWHEEATATTGTSATWSGTTS